MTHCAIYHTWPETKNAEYENIMRIIEAARNIGLDVTVTDNQGYPLFSTIEHIDEHHARLSNSDVDFAISLHFESPKLNDFYSYYALWNPLEFYFTWGYEKSINQFASHDDLLSCDSDLADAHGLNVYSALGRRPPLPLPRLHHSLSRETLQANISNQSRAFYIGINWERINNTKGRHHDLLVALDKAGMIDIYGPELFHGVRPWEGFEGYRGSIPFDGKTTIRRVSESGICLAFSSAAHQSSGVMSNRLFEGLNAGALIIANRHPFLEKFFEDTVLTIDDSLPIEQVIEDVKKIIIWVRENPAEANAKAKASQRIFRERFTLEESLSRLAELNEQRKASWVMPEALAKSVTGIVVCTDPRVDRLEASLASLSAQTHHLSAVVLVLDLAWYKRHRVRIDGLVQSLAYPVTILEHEIFASGFSLGQRRARKRIVGPVIWRALQLIQSDYFFILRSDEDIFVDHVAHLVRAMVREKAPGAMSGVLSEHLGEENRLQRRLLWLAPPDLDPLIFSNSARFQGHCLFAQEVIGCCDPTTFSLSDGQESNLLATVAFSMGGLAYSRSATYVFREQDHKYALTALIPPEHQHQYYRDATQGRAIWLDAARHQLSRLAVLQNQSDVGNTSRPERTDFVLKPGVTYALASNGNGTALVARGFYGFEEEGVWVKGRSGTLEFTFDATASDLDKLTKVRFELNAQGRRKSHTVRRQHTTVLVNNVSAGYLEVGDDWGSLIFEVSREVIETDPNVRVEFRLDHAEAVTDDAGVVIDERLLGMRIASLSVYLL